MKFLNQKMKSFLTLFLLMKKSFLQFGFDNIKNENYENKKKNDFVKKMKSLFYNYLHRYVKLALGIWKL